MQTTRRRVLSGGSLALAGLTLAGYAGAQTATEGTPADSSGVGDAEVATLGEAVTAFGVDLHRELVAEKPDENLLASPYSASIALAMTWAGARGETAAEMADALRYPYEQDRLHPTYDELDARVQSAGEVDDEDEVPFTLETANALWGQEGFPFAADFLDVLEANYGAGLREVDFASAPDDAREEINEWVAEQTEDNIEDLLGPSAVTDLTRLVLTNAVYFEANWAEPFDEDLTEPAPFTNLDGETVSVPSMIHSEPEEFPYAEVDGAQVLSLPYVGETVDMVVVLPPEGEFEAVESGLDAATLHSYFEALESRQGYVALPRFEYATELSLKEVLPELGMETAFDPDRANFEGMVSEDLERNLHVTDALQETFVAVDEEGTEAAAATAVSSGFTSIPQADFEMVVDRPFLYAIRHRETDATLFLGRVVALEGEEPESEDLPVVGDSEGPPADLDDDGLYEDVNGNDRADYDDAVTLFQHRDDDAVTDHVDAYDFNDNDRVDIDDAVELFRTAPE